MDKYESLVKDNPIADRFVNNFVANEYLAWALFSYLSDKKLIDHDDFLKYLTAYCTENIKRLSTDKD